MSRYPSINDHLDLKQARESDAALRFANARGASNWWHLIIHWNFTRYRDQPFAALQRVRSRTRKWYAERGIVHHDLWLREFPPADGAQTEHLHLVQPNLTPPLAKELSIRIESDKWAGALTDNAVRFGPCGTNPAYNVETLVLGYWLKGGNKAVQEAYDPPRL